MRLQKGTLKPFEELTGISANQISAYLNQRADMSKARSLVFEKASRDLGYDFTAADWMFDSQRVRQSLISRDTGEQ